MKKILVIIILVVFFIPLSSRAAGLSSTYPRLANYFLKWKISDTEAIQLAKWDVLILDMENQENSREQILKIRALNPHIIILAYITSEEILNDINNYNDAYLRQDFARGLDDSWWLKNSQGQKVSNWPSTSMLNLSDEVPLNEAGERYNDYLPKFVVNKLKSSGLWDGVFYDNIWGGITWISDKNLDLNNDGQTDIPQLANSLWSAGVKKILAKTRTLAGPSFIIVANGQVYQAYQRLLNGMMLEDFPSPWENGGTWSGSMQTYLGLANSNLSPQVSIINIYNKNQEDYQRMRFGLASTLLGDGFYSYDHDVTDHGQTWWYDEYNLNLGLPQSKPYNLLKDSDKNIQAGLWRRDFKNGIVLVNSTEKKQTYVFSHEEFEKINGSQDIQINNSKKINYISLASQDGLILRKRSNLILNSPFTNGYFYRVFDSAGHQERNGFFSYLNDYAGETNLIRFNDVAGKEKTLSAAQGRVKIYENDSKDEILEPYGPRYRGAVNLAAILDSQGIKTIITGAGKGGGPQVAVFDGQGSLRSRFFAYDKKLRGGVNIAIGDLNGDGQLEIVSGPGPGCEPIVKVFSLSGKLKKSFLAYNTNFQGGVNLAIGDLNGDGQLEIVTSPASHGGPNIRIFNREGKVLSSFFAYDTNFRGGLKLSLSDLNGDGQAEILVGLKNFY